jgi:hypothetical protein
VRLQQFALRLAVVITLIVLLLQGTIIQPIVYGQSISSSSPQPQPQLILEVIAAAKLAIVIYFKIKAMLELVQFAKEAWEAYQTQGCDGLTSKLVEKAPEWLISKVMNLNKNQDWLEAIIGEFGAPTASEALGNILKEKGVSEKICEKIQKLKSKGIEGVEAVKKAIEKNKSKITSALKSTLKAIEKKFKSSDKKRKEPGPINGCGSFLIELKGEADVPLWAPIFTLLIDGKEYQPTKFSAGHYMVTWKVSIQTSLSPGAHTFQIRAVSVPRNFGNFDLSWPENIILYGPFLPKSGARGCGGKDEDCDLHAKNMKQGEVLSYTAIVACSVTKSSQSTINTSLIAYTSMVNIDVLDNKGMLIYQIEEIAPHQSWQWDMRDQYGARVPNGVYLAVITVRDLSGYPIRREVRKIVVLR